MLCHLRVIEVIASKNSVVADIRRTAVSGTKDLHLPLAAVCMYDPSGKRVCLFRTAFWLGDTIHTLLQ